MYYLFEFLETTDLIIANKYDATKQGRTVYRSWGMETNKIKFVCLLTNRNIKTRNTNVNHNKNKYANWWITSVVKTTANSNPLYGENNKILIKRTF